MPSVLDSLVLELSLDDQKFAGPIKEASGSVKTFASGVLAALVDIDSHTEKTASAFSALKVELLELAGAYLGFEAAKGAISHIINLDTWTGRLAHTMAMSTRELAVWQTAAQQLGGTAEGISAGLQHINQQIMHFGFTGQSQLAATLRVIGVGLMNSNQQFLSPDELMKSIAHSPQFNQWDERTRAGYLQFAGFNQDQINMMYRGAAAFDRLFESARQVANANEESYRTTQEYQTSIALLDTSTVSLWRSFFLLANSIIPFQKAIVFMTDLMNKMRTGGGVTDVDQKLGVEQTRGLRWNHQTGRFEQTSSGGWLDKLFPNAAEKSRENAIHALWLNLQKDADARRRTEGAADVTLGDRAAGVGNSPGARAIRDSHIRAVAAKFEISEDMAMLMVAREGRGVGDNDRGSSFGDWQLHYGGIAPGMMQSGLGEEFNREYPGMSAKDPLTWPEQDIFSLQWAKTHGWGSWKSWQGSPFAGIGGFPTGAGAAASITNSSRGGDTRTTTSTTTIGTVVVNTNATNASDIAKDIKPQLERGSFASQAQGGAQ